MLSKCRQLSEQQRQEEAGPNIRQGLHHQFSEEPFHHISQSRARCTECSRPRNYVDGILCNNVPGQSRGPHLQCTEQPFHQCVIASAKHWYRYTARCTECSRPQICPDKLMCNSIPGLSRGPHLQCSELFHHCAEQTAQQWHTVICTECSIPRSFRDGVLCNNEPGQSRGPHLQCTEEHWWNSGRFLTVMQSLMYWT